MTHTARIIRFEVPVDDRWHTVTMPVGVIPLHVACRRVDTVEFWVEQWQPTDGTHLTENRRFRVYGTGHSYNPDTTIYRGTALTPEGGLVWHLFEGSDR